MKSSLKNAATSAFAKIALFAAFHATWVLLVIFVSTISAHAQTVASENSDKSPRTVSISATEVTKINSVTTIGYSNVILFNDETLRSATNIVEVAVTLIPTSTPGKFAKQYRIKVLDSAITEIKEFSKSGQYHATVTNTNVVDDENTVLAGNWMAFHYSKDNTYSFVTNTGGKYRNYKLILK